MEAYEKITAYFMSWIVIVIPFHPSKDFKASSWYPSQYFFWGFFGSTLPKSCTEHHKHCSLNIIPMHLSIYLLQYRSLQIPVIHSKETSLDNLNNQSPQSKIQESIFHYLTCVVYCYGNTTFQIYQKGISTWMSF